VTCPAVMPGRITIVSKGNEQPVKVVGSSTGSISEVGR